MFAPNFRINPSIAKALMSIEADRQAIVELPIDIAMLNSLRETARLAATHYSTQIEGNRLTQAQVGDTLAGAHFPGRERDETEVRNYYNALEEVEKLGHSHAAISEDDIQRIHALVIEGRSNRTPYRDGQNVIRDSVTGRIVYMPPEASDVPQLMRELVAWIAHQMEKQDIPAPLVASIAHYQFATIHPYYDGNGRTARLLTTLILHKTGYDLKGIYNLEEYYAQNLQSYYNALSIGISHNYYLGRREAEITGFVAYFCDGMATAFSAVRLQATKSANRGAEDQSPLIRTLDPRSRRLLTLFHSQGTASSHEIASHLGLSPRTVVVLCRDWVMSGLLQVNDPSRKNRSYRLAEAYESFVTNKQG